MSEHTKEPWNLVVDSFGHEYRVKDKDGDDVFADGDAWAKAPSELVASRIVACVNACAGISTETLERLPFSAAVAEESKQARLAIEQRDKLLASLKDCAYWAKDLPNDFALADAQEAYSLIAELEAA